MRSNDFTETIVDWVSGRINQSRFANLWLGGGAGPNGGSSYRSIDGQLTQRHICYDTSEPASPCSPSGFSSLMDNLRRMRYWQEPATWFGVETTSGLKVNIKPGLWYPSTTEYCAFAGGDSPTFTLPGVLDRVDTVYVDASGILHIQRGTPAVTPTITLPAIASGIPLWAVYLTPTTSGIYHPSCSGYYAGQGYIERDLRPFLNLGGTGTAASGVPNATAEGQALISNAALDWVANTTPLWKGEHSFEAGIAFVGATAENSITIPDADVNALHILDDTTGNEYIRFDTYNELFLIDPTADGIKVGIGLTTVPHGGVGAAKVAITGIDVSADGPHVQFTTDNDDYPLLQVLADKHDNVCIFFDAYYDYASWKSSDLGSNCMLHKESDLFQISYDSGIGAGNNITWNTGLVMDLTNGNVGIGTTGPVTALDVNGVISLQDAGTKNFNAGIVTEVGASLLEFGINEGSGNRFGGAYTQANQGGFFRWDARAAQPLLTIYGRVAGVASNAGSILTTLLSDGKFGVGVTPTQRFCVGGGRSYFAPASEPYAIGVAYDTARQAAGQNFYLGATDSATPDFILSNVTGAERVRVKTGGYVGIGRTVPYGPLHGYGSYGGFMHFEADAIGAAEVTVIPNGAGDVVYGLHGLSVFHCAGGANEFFIQVFLETPGAGNVTQNLYVAGGQTFVIRLYADGHVTVVRTAGAQLGRWSIWLVWL